MWIRALDQLEASPAHHPADEPAPIATPHGGKAHGLAALLKAGLPVPDGFVVTDAAFRAVVGPADLAGVSGLSGLSGLSGVSGDLEHLGHALDQLAATIEAAQPPPELVAEVSRRVHQLVHQPEATAAEGPGGARLAVRSSISLEDRSAGAAAGVFSSRLSVAPDDVWPAIRAVWASVCTPLAAAYARLHRPGGTSQPLAVEVIVQRYIPGARLTIYTREPGRPTSPIAWIERGAELRKLPRDTDEAALQLALRAERALGLEQGGADVELIARPRAKAAPADHGADGADEADYVIVQARPIIHPQVTSKVPVPPIVISALVADGRCWSADLAHNPDPLSPAQAGLVELIEQQGASPYALRLCAGTLYATPRELPDVPAPATVEELRARFAAIEARAAAALGEPCPHDLPATLAAYLALYRLWAFEMSPLVAAARRAGNLATQGPRPVAAGSRPSSVEALLLACARGQLDEHELLRRIGDLSPAWDVAAPTLAESPQGIGAALARARARVQALDPDRAPAERGAEAPTLAEVAAELAELDDLWFARAQARVRRALLARGAALAIGDDVLWLSLAELLAATSLDPEAAHARAAAARAAHRRASGWRMPAIIGGAAAVPPRWRGVGFGGVVTGRVVHIHHLWEPPMLPLGAIAVVPAVTPALAVALLGASAIVSETGGLLDHGAAMARELGIPCVVGCSEAMALPSHALVQVDGDGGAISVLDE